MRQLAFHFTLAWWIILIGFGSMCIWTAIILLINDPLVSIRNFQTLTHDIIALLFCTLAFLLGGLSVATPFFSKIILSQEGIEYQNAVAIVKAPWNDVTLIGHKKNINIRISNPEVKLRSWSRYLPLDVKKGAIRNGIPFANFPEEARLTVQRLRGNDQQV